MLGDLTLELKRGDRNSESLFLVVKKNRDLKEGNRPKKKSEGRIVQKMTTTMGRVYRVCKQEFQDGVLRNRIFRDVGYERDEGNRLPGGVFLL